LEVTVPSSQAAKVLIAKFCPAALYIARAARALLAKKKREPTLADVLSGVVTQEMMAADRVAREDVERLMTEAKRNKEGREQ
jgi:hypothetical protein